MATVINNPSTDTSGGGGMGVVLGIILAIVLIVLFFLYGLPAIRGNRGGTNINVPDKVDVNVNNPSGGSQ